MKTLLLRDRAVSTENPAFIMAIVNATPDSFFSESRGSLERALKMIDEGADILDIGGESTRPGSEYVDADEEIRRVVPLVKEIRKHSDIPISIDTRKKSVMQAAFDAGADILNDVSALEDDDGMADFCAETKIPVVLMHKRGIPGNMQNDTRYGNVFDEVSRYLEERATFALSKGIEAGKIIVDPGVGFGKDLDGNIQLIKNCGKLCDGKYPVLMALSRKTCIGQMTGRDVEGRLYGTLAADMLSVLNGAFMVRVHDCAPCVDTFAVLKSLL
ncbi:dihydropteroate synthase [Treponema sp.]|uniref:dihydropteroate synthase n=1 Tax=Treponema sp. TaxID=166 RepID=UPI00388D5936